MEIYSDEHGFVIASLSMRDQCIDEDTYWNKREMQKLGECMKANADLVAAAPELLDVLKMARERCERLPDDPDTDYLVRAIDEVIAKAEGRA